MSSVAKFIVGLIGAALLWVATYLAAGGHMTVVSWIQLAIQVVAAVGVYVAANLPQYPYAKTIIAAVLAVLQLTVTLLLRDGHLTQPDIWALVIALLTTLGVYAFPNTPPGPITA